MENASKALMIAGEVLIGVILLTVLVYAFKSGAEFSESTDDSIAQISISKFNSKFTVYIGRNNVSWHELVSLMNLAENIKGSTDLTVVVDIKPNPANTGVDQIKDQISKPEKNEETYSCIGIEYDKNTQLVNLIKFKKN